MKENALANGSAEPRHPIGQPRRHTPAMQGEIGMARASHSKTIINQSLCTNARLWAGSGNLGL